MLPLKVARPTARRVVILGDPSTGIIRIGTSDWVHVRLDTDDGEPARAYLPRSRTGTLPAVTVPATPIPADWFWDDAFLPVIDTPLYAVPFGNTGADAGLLAIDASTLPPVAPEEL